MSLQYIAWAIRKRKGFYGGPEYINASRAYIQEQIEWLTCIQLHPQLKAGKKRMFPIGELNPGLVRERHPS
jgi:hypothetical protein